MKRTHHKIEQNTPEWLLIRNGLFTSSDISDLFTKPQAKADKEAGLLSKSATTLAEQKALEALGFEKEEIDSKATEWGKEYEDYAAKVYSEVLDRKIYFGGFHTYGENTGSSPDRLVGKDGLLETKCPKNQIEHLTNLLKVNNESDLLKYRKEYYLQIQHQLYVTARLWCDFVSFDIRLFNKELTTNAGLKVVRIYPNLEVFAEFDQRIKAASEMRDKIMNQILYYRI
jgi:hypothetical protein